MPRGRRRRAPRHLLVVILPLCTPVLAVCAVFMFLGTWNDLLGP